MAASEIRHAVFLKSVVKFVTERIVLIKIILFYLFFLALIGFGTLSFASTFLKVTSSHFKTFIVLVLKSKQVAEEVAKIMDLHVAKGYSYILAWIGESLMLVNMITTIVEARVVRSEFHDESYKLVNRRKRNIVV